MKRKSIIWLVIVCLILSVLAACEGSDYKKAQAMLDSGKYTAAAMAFKALGAYQDAPEKAKESTYQWARKCTEVGECEEADTLFSDIAGYKDADEQKLLCEKEIKYREAVRAMGKRTMVDDMLTAAALFKGLGDYKDSPALLKEAEYKLALKTGSNMSPSGGYSEFTLNLLEQSGDYSSDVEAKKAEARANMLWEYIRENGELKQNDDGRSYYYLSLDEEQQTENRKKGYYLKAFDALWLEIGYIEVSLDGVGYVNKLAVEFNILSPEKAQIGALKTAVINESNTRQQSYLGSVDITTARSSSEFSQSSYTYSGKQSGQEFSFSDLEKYPMDTLSLYPWLLTEFEKVLNKLPVEVTMSDLGFGRNWVENLHPDAFTTETDEKSETEENADDIQGENPAETLWNYINKNGEQITDDSGVSSRRISIKQATDGKTTSFFLFALPDKQFRLHYGLEVSSGSGNARADGLKQVTVEFSANRPEEAKINLYWKMGAAYLSNEEIFNGTADITTAKEMTDLRKDVYIKNTVDINQQKKASSDYSKNTFPGNMYFDAITAMDDLMLESMPFSVTMRDLGFGRNWEQEIETVAAEETPQPADEVPSSEEEEKNTSADVNNIEPQSGDKLPQEEKAFIVNLSGTALRRGPGEAYEVLAMAETEQEFSVSAVSNGWLYAKNAAGVSGWLPVKDLFGRWMFGTDINPALNGIEKPEKVSVKPEKITTKDNANARSGPNTKKAQIGRYDKGTTGVLIGTSGVWKLICFDGVYGWVHGNNF